MSRSSNVGHARFQSDVIRFGKASILGGDNLLRPSASSHEFGLVFPETSLSPWAPCLAGEQGRISWFQGDVSKLGGHAHEMNLYSSTDVRLSQSTDLGPSSLVVSKVVPLLFEARHGERRKVKL
jgi:hypothetical protein